MANKKFWFGMLVMVLVFGMATVGCDNGTIIDDPREVFFGTWFFVDGNEASFVTSNFDFILTISSNSIRGERANGFYWTVNNPSWSVANNENTDTKNTFQSGYVLSGTFTAHSNSDSIGNPFEWAVFINSKGNRLVWEHGNYPNRQDNWVVLNRQ